MQHEELNRRAFLAELINDSSIDCVLAVDVSLNIISWNKRCELLTGKSQESVLGQPLRTLYPGLVFSEALCDALDEALRGRASFVPVDKGIIIAEYMETHVIPLRDAGEVIIGILIIRHDVAHRIKAEYELKWLNEVLEQKNLELRQLNNELLSFSNITSRDLKEPLRKIRGFIDILKEREAERLSAEGLFFLKRIQYSAGKIETLTDDIYTFSQVNRLSEPLSEVALNHVLKFTENNFQKQIREKEAVIEAGKLPTITGYRTLLYELFQNLIDNALKFQAEHNKPLLHIQASTIAGSTLHHAGGIPDKDYICIDFTDNGIGLESQYSERIFELFQKLDPHPQDEGNGIGLALCKKIMALHQGFITVGSVVGKGSTFSCYFPVATDHAPSISQ